MKKTKKLEEKLLEELERTPIIQVACEKVGISRNTLYRWKKEDLNFATRLDEAVGMGVSLVNDIAESNVLNGIRNKEFNWTRLWLGSRHPEYRKPYRPPDAREDPEVKRRWAEAKRKEIQEFFGKWGLETPKKSTSRRI